MSHKNPVADPEITDVLKRTLDDLERMESIMRGAIIALDDMRGRILFRYEGMEPGPWDDEHPENTLLA